MAIVAWFLFFILICGIVPLVMPWHLYIFVLYILCEDRQVAT